MIAEDFGHSDRIFQENRGGMTFMRGFATATFWLVFRFSIFQRENPLKLQGNFPLNAFFYFNLTA